MATKNIVPRATGEGSLGTSEKKWGNIYADNITLVDGETLDTKISSIKDTADTAYTTAMAITDDKLSLSGGTMTGTIYSSATNILCYQGDYCSIYNTTIANGAGLLLRSKDSSTNAGGFELTARDGTNAQSLKGTSDGVLTWNNTGISLEGHTHDDYLPLSAGSSYQLTGQIYTSNTTLARSTNTSYLQLAFATTSDGARLVLSHKDRGDGYLGRFSISTGGDAVIDLIGTNDGKLTWNDKNVATASTSGVGGTTTPVYINSSGVTAACTAYVSAEVQMAKRLRVATCTTAAGTAAKVATLSGFTLATGACIILYHTKRIYAGDTLNVNNTGAKPIMISGATDSTYYSPGGSYLAICYYNGTNWILEGMTYGYTGAAAE